MSTFAYKAVDDSGRISSGSLEAEALSGIEQQLHGRGLYLLSATRTETVSESRGSVRFVARFTRILAGLLDSGLPLTRALSSIAKTAKPEESAMLVDVRKRLEKGDTFARALEAHKDFFPPLFLGVVRAGERSGTLAASLQRLAIHTDTELEIRQKLSSAAVYPILLLTSGSASVALLLFLILPRFATLLADAGATLPWSTSMMLGLSRVLRSAVPFAAPIAGITGALVVWTTTADAGKRFLSAALFRLPWIGDMRRAAIGARFARLIGVLLNGGAPMLDTIRIAAGSFNDPVVRESIMTVHARLREGARLSDAMQSTNLFPDVLLELGRFGEESARLPQFMERAAEVLEMNSQETMRRMTTLAEPMMIVFFGAIVGFVALSLLQAVYGLNADAFR